jgi:hypothetical protein
MIRHCLHLCGPLTISYICCFLRRIIGATLARRFPNVCFRRVVVGIHQADGMALFTEIRHIRAKYIHADLQIIDARQHPAI